MPTIIDNLKVAEKIKKLLKDNNMTQEQLANKLSITKSAVSQNLRGKSNFDIQNLVAIAKLFNITLDELLSIHQNDSAQVQTIYQTLVKQGVDAINKIPLEDINVSTPDLYGRVLVEYIIKEDEKEMFGYLHEHEIELVNNNYHRAKEVYLQVIYYMLDQKLGNAFNYILEYTKIMGSFSLDDTYEQSIWSLLNESDNNATIQELIAYGKDNGLWHKIPFMKHVIPITNRDLLTIIAKYHLDHVFDHYLKIVNPKYNIHEITKIFLKHDYDKGLKTYVDYRFKSKIKLQDRLFMNLEDAAILMIRSHDLELLKLVLEKEVYININTLLLEAVKLGFEDTIDYIIKNCHPAIDYYKIAVKAVEVSDVKTIDKIADHLKQDQLNKLLSVVSKDDVAMLKVLFEKGARFATIQFEDTQFDKINNLIDHLIKGENNGTDK